MLRNVKLLSIDDCCDSVLDIIKKQLVKSSVKSHLGNFETIQGFVYLS
jgi:hypothetical protein